jgi:hypothetical protein
VNSGDPEEWAIPAYCNTLVCVHHQIWYDYNPVKDKGSKTASEHLSSGCCQPAHDIFCRNYFLILKVLGRPMGYHDYHWKKNKVTLQRRVMIQNLSNLTIYHFSCKLPNFSYYISDFTYFCSQHLVTDIYASLVKYWILCFFPSAFQIWRKIP